MRDSNNNIIHLFRMQHITKRSSKVHKLFKNVQEMFNWLILQYLQPPQRVFDHSNLLPHHTRIAHLQQQFVRLVDYPHHSIHFRPLPLYSGKVELFHHWGFSALVTRYEAPHQIGPAHYSEKYVETKTTLFNKNHKTLW